MTNTKTQIDKAYDRYLATRKAYQQGKANLKQLAHALAVYDVTLTFAKLSK